MTSGAMIRIDRVWPEVALHTDSTERNQKMMLISADIANKLRLGAQDVVVLSDCAFTAVQDPELPHNTISMHRRIQQVFEGTKNSRVALDVVRNVPDSQQVTIQGYPAITEGHTLFVNRAGLLQELAWVSGQPFYANEWFSGCTFGFSVVGPTQKIINSAHIRLLLPSNCADASSMSLADRAILYFTIQAMSADTASRQDFFRLLESCKQIVLPPDLSRPCEVSNNYFWKRGEVVCMVVGGVSIACRLDRIVVPPTDEPGEDQVFEAPSTDEPGEDQVFEVPYAWAGLTTISCEDERLVDVPPISVREWLQKKQIYGLSEEVISLCEALSSKLNTGALRGPILFVGPMHNGKKTLVNALLSKVEQDEYEISTVEPADLVSPSGNIDLQKLREQLNIMGKSKQIIFVPNADYLLASDNHLVVEQLMFEFQERDQIIIMTATKTDRKFAGQFTAVIEMAFPHDEQRRHLLHGLLNGKREPDYISRCVGGSKGLTTGQIVRICRNEGDIENALRYRDEDGQGRSYYVA